MPVSQAEDTEHRGQLTAAGTAAMSHGSALVQTIIMASLLQVTVTYLARCLSARQVLGQRDLADRAL